jgi:hypothetical protein
MHSASLSTDGGKFWCAIGYRQTAYRPPCEQYSTAARSGGGGESANIDPDWGEPSLTSAEKIYGWNSFIVLSMLSGRPENPVNAVAPNATAHCQIRYTVDSDPAEFEPALRQHLDEQGFPEEVVGQIRTGR